MAMKVNMQTIYDCQNATAAAVILSAVEQFGSDEAGLVRWARFWTRQQRPKQEQPALFGTEVAGEQHGY